MQRFAWAVVISLACVSAPAVAQPAAPVTVETKTSPLAEALDAKFRDAMKDSVAGAVLLEENGKVTLRGGYGYANREEKLPFTTHTIAQIGSITKQFTAMALIDLWRQGKIDFAKPVKTYIPDVAEPVASLTLDQILTHSSGMPEYCGDDFDRLSKTDLLSKCATTKLAFAPGTKFSYSNPGYSIIAAVAEQVSGEDIDTYLKRHFFAKLGMRDAGYDFPGVPRERFAVGYLDNKNMGVIDQSLARLGGDYWNVKGNGGIQASTEDMYRWYQALSRPDGVITAAMRDEATKPRFRDEEGDAWEGYGWVIRKAPDGHVVQISHSGSDGTFFSHFYWRTDDKTFMYFVSNSGETNAKPLIKNLMTSIRDAGAMPVTKPSGATKG